MQPLTKTNEVAIRSGRSAAYHHSRFSFSRYAVQVRHRNCSSFQQQMHVRKTKSENAARRSNPIRSEQHLHTCALQPYERYTRLKWSCLIKRTSLAGEKWDDNFFVLLSHLGWRSSLHCTRDMSNRRFCTALFFTLVRNLQSIFWPWNKRGSLLHALSIHTFPWLSLWFKA